MIRSTNHQRHGARSRPSPPRLRTLTGSFGILLLCVLLPAALLSGCSGGEPRYGVILLSPNEDALQTGSFVDIEERSEINETFTVALPDGDRQYELDVWRVKSFETSSKARSYAEAYASNVNLYAENRQDGLAVREEPRIDSQRVYKLRKGQKIKILEKAKADTIGSHEGHWYRVLTLDGVAGYCFDHYLDIYDATAEETETENPALARLREELSKSYRPADFRDMSESGRIRFDRFDPQYGLSVDFEARTIRVNMYTYTHTFDFEAVEQTGENSFFFAGAGVKLTLKAEETLQLVYTRDNKNYSPSFVRMGEEEIRSLIEEERKRREQAYEDLRSAGPRYSSSAYGQLSFTGEEEFTFSWKDYGRLVPRVIPSGTSGSGTVRFGYFLSDSLKQEYEGVIALDFRELSAEPLLFMYSLEDGQMKLEHVTREKVDDGLVQERSSYPLIMAFFTQTEQ